MKWIRGDKAPPESQIFASLRDTDNPARKHGLRTKLSKGRKHTLAEDHVLRNRWFRSYFQNEDALWRKNKALRTNGLVQKNDEEDMQYTGHKRYESHFCFEDVW